MTTINEIFRNAQLALASYAVHPERKPGKLPKALTDKDDGADFTESQANEFVSRYSVYDHQENLSDGFSATVFLDKETNRYTLAVRGTEPLFNPDILDADADITLYGMAFSQTVSLYNYVQRLITPAAQQAPGDA